MRAAIGTQVLTSDGDEAGTIDRLILNPDANEVRAVVLRKGALLPATSRCRCRPSGRGRTGRCDWLTPPANSTNSPTSSSSNYSGDLPAGALMPVGYGPAGLVWPAGYGDLPPAGPLYDDPALAPEERARLRRQDLENAVFAEGSAIISRDGEPVGSLARLDFDAVTGDLARIVFGQGLIFTSETALPASAVARAADRVLYLALDKATIDAWTRLAEGQAVWTRDGQRLGTIRRQVLDALDVQGEAPPRRMRVPLTAVARLDNDRVLLAADAADAARWAAPPDDEAPLERATPML